jgi:predicted transport protein
VNQQNLQKHGEILGFLKEKHGFTHGFANLVAHKAKGSDAGSVENTSDLIAKQYSGKENLKPIYEKLMAEIAKFGDDIETAPKNAYVSLRRKTQFALLQPATKTRFEIGLFLKGQESVGRLEAITAVNSMCSHKINISGIGDIDQEVLNWLKTSYNNSK